MFRARNYQRTKICTQNSQVSFMALKMYVVWIMGRCNCFGKFKVIDFFGIFDFGENFLGVLEGLNVAKAEEDVTEWEIYVPENHHCNLVWGVSITVECRGLDSRTVRMAVILME